MSWDGFPILCFSSLFQTHISKNEKEKRGNNKKAMYLHYLCLFEDYNSLLIKDEAIYFNLTSLTKKWGSL